MQTEDQQQELPEPKGVEPGDTIPNTLGPIPRPYADPDDGDPAYARY